MTSDALFGVGLAALLVLAMIGLLVNDDRKWRRGVGRLVELEATIARAQAADDKVLAVVERQSLTITGFDVGEVTGSITRLELGVVCAYCGRYGPLGNCAGCGAANRPVPRLEDRPVPRVVPVPTFNETLG